MTDMTKDDQIILLLEALLIQKRNQMDELVHLRRSVKVLEEDNKQLRAALKATATPAENKKSNTGRKKIFDEQQVRRIREMYKKMSIRTIAIKYGVAPETVRRVVCKLGTYAEV